MQITAEHTERLVKGGLVREWMGRSKVGGLVREGVGRSRGGGVS